MDTETNAPLAREEAEALERVRLSFAKQPMMATLGARLTRLEPGRVAIALPHREAVSQQHGYIHGGAIMTIADSASGYASMTMVATGSEVLTIEGKTNFLRPARGALVAEGRVIRAGRSVIVAAADVYTEDERRHVATMLATMAVLPPSA